ncbi:MAG: DUF4430 domain-containing protein [Promethearchaeota archaeon]
MNRLRILMLVIALIVIPVDASSHSVAISHNLRSNASGVSLHIDYGNGTTSTYTEVEGPTVLNITESVAIVGVDWTGDLAFVYSINGVSSKEETGLWWQFWVNGEFSSVAANFYEVQDNDTIVWRFTDSQVEPPSTTPADGFEQYAPLAVASAGLGSLGIGFLVALYLMRRRN